MIASTSMVGGDDCAHAEFVTIGDLSREFHISPSTLRRMVDGKLLPSFITDGGHRRIFAKEAREWFSARVRQEESSSIDGPSSVIAYCRVSTGKQSKGLAKGGDSGLTRQIDRCKAHSLEHYGEAQPTIYSDTSSGLNDERGGLVRMLDAILSGKHDGAKLLVTYRDRLARFGTNIMLRIFAAHRIEVEFIESAPTEETEKELAEDIIAILTCFSAKHYGRRGGNAVSVKVGDKELRDIFAMAKAGYTPRDIAARMRKEGRAVGECGKPISRMVIIRLLRKNRKVISEVIPTEQASFAKWFAKHARKVEGARTQRKLIMAAYREWLGANPNEVNMNNTAVGLWVKRQGISKRFGQGGEVVYVDVELR